jgi:excisionase family DNA binding protein
MAKKSYFIDVVLPSSGFAEKPSYSLPEVAVLFGKTPRTIRTYIRDGRLTAVGDGRDEYRVYKKELIQYFSKYDYEE